MNPGGRNGPCVLVTEATLNSGLAMIRALGAAGAEVVGCDDRALPLGLHSRYSTPYRVYPPNSSADRCVEGLLGIVREERPDVLLSIGTMTTATLVKHRERFDAITALNLPDAESFYAAVDNARTLHACHELSIRHPQLLNEAEALARLEAGAGDAPRVVVKPRADVGGGRGVHYPADADALRRALEACRRYGEPMFQEYAPGPPDQMHTVLMLYDRDSHLVAAFTMRKLRQWPRRGGNTAIAVSTCMPELVELVRPLFERWRWRGPAEVELKLDASGVARLIEVNPRFSGYVGFPVTCGLNLPLLACRVAMGPAAALPFPSYAVGAKYFNSHLTVRSAWAQLRQERDPLRLLTQLRRELAGRPRPNSLAPTDPLPRLGKLLAEMLDALAPAGAERLKRRGVRNPLG